jgi:hypothetical protein
MGGVRSQATPPLQPSELESLTPTFHIVCMISAHGQLSGGLRSFADIHANGEVALITAVRIIPTD